MLPKTAEYALRAIACLADSTDKRSADQLAATTQVPRRYLHKVLQDLAAAELVVSRSGPGGGYSLAKSATEISVLEVVQAVGPLERIRHCPLGLPSHTTLCPLHAELDRAYARTEETFASVVIQDLLQSKGSVRALCDVAAN